MRDMIAFLWWSFFPSMNIRVYERAAEFCYGKPREVTPFCIELLKNAWNPCSPREKRFIDKKYIEPARILLELDHE